jgi:hypothetical protein
VTLRVDQKDEAGQCQLVSNLTLDGPPVSVLGGTVPPVPLTATLERVPHTGESCPRPETCEPESRVTGSSSSSAALEVQLVLSAIATTTTKATELKSLQDGIEHTLQKRREVRALLQTESKELNDRMQLLAGPLFPTFNSPHHCLNISGKQIR